MSPGKLVDDKDVGCQDKSGPGKIHEVILVSFSLLKDSGDALFCGHCGGGGRGWGWGGGERGVKYFLHLFMSPGLIPVRPLI